jgi:hypothetical protein
MKKRRMGKTNLLRSVGLLLGLAALAAGGLSAPATAARYSASGMHQCNADNGSHHACVVTGSYFSSCNEAASALQMRDCCPSARGGGTSAGFSLNYCIPNPGR